jgi:hypothetical protein
MLQNFSKELVCPFPKTRTGKSPSAQAIKRHAMTTHGRVETAAPAFLTSTLDRTRWSASRLGHIRSWEVATGTQQIGGWLGPSLCLDFLERRESILWTGIESWPS